MTWLGNARFGRLFRRAKFSTWLENQLFVRIFRVAKFSTWPENALESPAVVIGPPHHGFCWEALGDRVNLPVSGTAY
jgi:hypothetical protein